MLYETVDLGNAARKALRSALKEAKGIGLTDIKLTAPSADFVTEITRLRQVDTNFVEALTELCQANRDGVCEDDFSNDATLFFIGKVYDHVEQKYRTSED